MAWGSISLFAGFLEKENSLETLIVIFEKVSPNMKNFEISVFTANYRYLQTAALKEKIPRMSNMSTVQVIEIVVRKCDEELGEVARKLDIIISISLAPKNYSTRNRKDFKKSIRVLE